MNNNRNLLIACAAIVLLVIVYASMKTFSNPSNLSGANATSTGNSSAVVCTADAYQCADGSWVGRSGSHCQFVCPIKVATSTSKNTLTVEGHVGVVLTPFANRITVKEVLEDSRCPAKVQCIQAGTVRVQADVEAISGTKSVELALNKPVTVGNETITLIDVTPTKEEGTTISPSDYRFVFKVVKK